jgi:hypothetical protein
MACDTILLDMADSNTRDDSKDILKQVKALGERIAELEARETELRVILQRDSELEPYLERLHRTIGKESTIQHVAAAVDGAALCHEPFAHVVIDNLLPGRVYDSLLRGLPPVELFANKPAGKQHLDVPFSLAPTYSQRIWGYMATDLVPNVIAPKLIEKFQTPINAWVAANWPDLPPDSVKLHGSGGRIMYRRRGYRIRPHRDPKWSFITCIFYLARPGDKEEWGTQLYAVDDDREADSAAPYWIDEKQCRLVLDVEFRPNRVLVFLNSVGAHGAYIPADAEPADLERYIYQFRLGPSLEVISMLKSMLPEERQRVWAGKALVDY